MSLKIGVACLFSSIAFGQLAGLRVSPNGDSMKVTLDSVRSPGAVVLGAPYSGEQTMERVQTLADGTHITTSTGNEKRWRDSRGRTRTERQIGAKPESNVEGWSVVVGIRDPVAGFEYLLDDQNKVAHRLALAAVPAPVSALPAQPAPAKPAPSKPGHEFKMENLGTETIEGVIAEHQKLTQFYPVGAIGNDRPVVSTNEFWFSKDLKITILSKSSDPRSGDMTTRLTNISRDEPDAALFQVPEGYTVVDEKDSATITLKRQ